MKRQAQKHENKLVFARLISEGMRKADAYRRAFGRLDVSEEAAKMGASRMLRDVTVCEKMKELEDALDRSSVMSKQELLKMLSRRVRVCDGVGDVRGMIACIVQLNKMQGFYEPAKVEVQGDVVREFVLSQIEMASKEPLVKGGRTTA